MSLIAIVMLAVIVLTHYSPEPRVSQPAPGIDDSTWIEDFSITKYQPLVRLTSEEDERYIASHLGLDVAAAYRKVRRKVMRDYLRALSRDFNRIHAIASSKAARAQEDQGSLPLTLVEQQMRFIFHIWTIEAKLYLAPVFPCRLEFESMLTYIEAMAAQTRELTRPQLSYQVM